MSLFVKSINNILLDNINNLSFLDKFLSFKNKTISIFNNDSYPNVKRAFIKFNALEIKRNFLGDANFEKLLLLSVNTFFELLIIISGK